MTRIVPTALLGLLLLLCHCTVHMPYRKNVGSDRRDFPGESAAAVWQDCLDTCAALGIQIREAADGRIRSRKIRGRGVNGRLHVFLTETGSGVSVYSFVEARRDADTDVDLTEGVVDPLLGLDPEDELDDLERDYERGRISWYEYSERRDRIEEEIEAREEARDAEWDAADEALLQTMAEWSHRFLTTLAGRVAERRSGVSPP